MKNRIIALLLAALLAVSLCAAPAFAEETAETTAPPAAEVPSPAGPDGALAEGAVIVPDAMGFLSFANLERRIREKNLNVLAIQESVNALQELDYEDLEEDLRKQLNNIAKMQRLNSHGLGLDLDSMMPYPITETEQMFAANQLEAGYDSLREQFDAVRDGEMQKDNAGVIRQLKSLQDQVVMGGEMLYLTLAGLEIQEAALQRQLEGLNRTVEEMTLRHEMGQISALQLQQVENGRAALVSGLHTLQMNIVNLKYQLEMMVGAEMTGELALGPVAAVTEKQLESMDLEKDLAAAKTASYEIYAAEKTYEDAEEEYDEIWKRTRSDDLEYKNAVHNRAAAKYTYNASIQDYELRFRKLYAQVKDYAQVLEAAETALEYEKGVYASMELKHQQGTISRNALLDAKSTLQTAEEKVTTASNDLFSSYNTYCWAVQHGILN